MLFVDIKVDIANLWFLVFLVDFSCYHQLECGEISLYRGSIGKPNHLDFQMTDAWQGLFLSHLFIAFQNIINFSTQHTFPLCTYLSNGLDAQFITPYFHSMYLPIQWGVGCPSFSHHTFILQLTYPMGGWMPLFITPYFHS